jgi:hypothetical protein
MFHVTRLHLLALPFLAAAACLFAAPSQECRADDTYAAIAYSPNTGRYGYATGRPTRAAAESVAVAECNRPDARVVVWSRNEYCALAVGDNRKVYGYGYSPDKEEARAIALREAEKRTTNCFVILVIHSDD